MNDEIVHQENLLKGKAAEEDWGLSRAHVFMNKARHVRPYVGPRCLPGCR